MLIDKYFEYQIEYEKKYGLNTLVLMQVGSFFEFYGIDNQEEKIGNSQYIAELLNIQLTRRNWLKFSAPKNICSIFVTSDTSQFPIAPLNFI